MFKNLLFLSLIATVMSCTNGNDTTTSNQKKGPKNGLVHAYNEDGSISASINYVEGIRHGLASDFYTDGKLRAEIDYVNGVKEGLAKWYHKNGKAYRVTSYLADERHGTQKKYYEDGELMSEALYFENHPGLGLREFSKSGQERKAVPKFTFTNKKTMPDGTVVVQVKLANKVKEVSLYQGELTDSIYLHDNLREINKTANTGFAKIPAGKNEVTVLAKYKTRYKNYRVVQGIAKR
jgi:hypothetical protein